MTRDRSVVTGPRWRALADDITERIRTGRLKPGDKLPSIEEQAKADNSQTTTLAAYRHLRDTGYVVMVQGVGTFVAPSPPAAGTSLEERIADHERRIAALERERRGES